MWYVIHNDTLAHHGILGQKWGKRNGPPYPLGAGDHSASERNAGWRKSLDKGGGDSYNKKRKANTASGHTGRPGGRKTDKPKRGLTTGQKRAIAICAAAVAAGLAAYGGYKLYQSGKLDPVLSRFAKKGELLAGELPESGTVIPFANKEPVGSGLKRLAKPESLEETIRNANPERNLNNPLYKNNCTYCGIAAILRRRGFDVIAKDTGGEMQNLLSVVENVFNGAKTLEGSAVKFGKSPEDAADMLLRRLQGWKTPRPCF